MIQYRFKIILHFFRFFVGAVVLVLLTSATPAQAQPGEQPALGPRITQEMIENDLTLKQIRKEGRRIFSTPFNTLDGLGDGPINPLDKVTPGGRPTLQDNGIFLRMNGLDSQACLECHSVLSNAEIPATFAPGGVGGASANAFPGVIAPDIADAANNGFAAIQGRIINPPFSFGSGGIELLAAEMTTDLQALKDLAELNAGTWIDLVTKGVSFGSIVFENGDFNLSDVEGIDDDLVVRPFGRKGCCETIRVFDIGALQFHHGIQPVEVVGEGNDPDEDGVSDELTIGELSALHIWQVALERPKQRGTSAASDHGEEHFVDIGCAVCHIPTLTTDSKILTVHFPEGGSMDINLNEKPPRFKQHSNGVKVDLYADLKRHDMGPGLEESTGDALAAFFTTARLWGVADTAPYLHDGRATTLTDAILFHGGEAESSRDAFVDDLNDSQKEELLAFLRTLRTPKKPGKDLDSSDDD